MNVGRNRRIAGNALGWLCLAGVLALTGCKTPVGNATNEPETAIRQQQSLAGNNAVSETTSSYAAGNERRRDQKIGGARTAQPGQFDYYLLTLSWSPEFCYMHPDKPECGSGARFVVHGLWPENNDGSYPEACSNAPEPKSPSQYSDLYPDKGLLQHEWKTHGTCSGLSADDYFITMRRAVQSVKIPDQLANVAKRITLTPDEIVTDFVHANGSTTAVNYTVGCGNNFLTQVQVCMDKNMNPVACRGVHTCGATVVTVTPPDAARSANALGYGGDGGSQRRRSRR